jgi:hypothetical protein
MFRADELKLWGYFDDSGDPNNSNQSCVTIAGYVTTKKGWDWFGRSWSQVMCHYDVPYLHMKEMWNRDGVYRHIKADPAKEADFLSDCIRTIHTTVEFSTSATIRLADLKRFNHETGLEISALSLALYGCLIEIRKKYPTEEIEIVIDRITKPTLVIDTARLYAATDTYANLAIQSLNIKSLSDGLTFRNTPPIQAADFLAWETNRNCEERKTWNPTEVERAHPARFRRSYDAWRIKFAMEYGRLPRDRMSAKSLTAWPPPSGYLWDHYLIRAAHLSRHVNGWGV